MSQLLFVGLTIVIKPILFSNRLTRIIENKKYLNLCAIKTFFSTRLFYNFQNRSFLYLG
jgi:hypothetical protein